MLLGIHMVQTQMKMNCDSLLVHMSSSSGSSQGQARATSESKQATRAAAELLRVSPWVTSPHSAVAAHGREFVDLAGELGEDTSARALYKLAYHSEEQQPVLLAVLEMVIALEGQQEVIN